jgi:hypothetical protein
MKRIMKLREGRRISVLVGIALLALASQARAQETHGEVWLSLSDSERMLYLAGWNQGVNTAHMWHSMLVTRLPDERKAFANLFATFRDAYSLEGFNEKVVSDLLTALYKDPANSQIRTELLVPVVIRKLQGEPADSVQARIEWARRISVSAKAAGGSQRD